MTNKLTLDRLAELRAVAEPARLKTKERMRACANGVGDFKTERGDYGLCDDAADALEAAEERVKELEGALGQIVSDAQNSSHCAPEQGLHSIYCTASKALEANHD